MREVDITVVALDGINSLKTGVGTVVVSFLRSINEISTMLQNVHIKIGKLTAITSLLNENSLDINYDILCQTKGICTKHHGTVDYITSYASGDKKSEIWMGTKKSGTCAQWTILSKNAAVIIEKITRKDVPHIVFAHDTPFSNMSRFMSIHENSSIVWIPHCLGLTTHDRWQDIKIPFEHEGIQAIINRNDAIGSISNHFTQSIVQDSYQGKPKIYSISNFFQNEIRNRYNIATKHKRILDTVDNNAPIIFAWGRCSEAKGWDIFLPAARQFLESPHGVHFQAIFICPMGTAAPAYEQRIVMEYERFPHDRTHVLTTFSAEEPLRILGLSNLRIVAFASRFEGMSLTAIEALELCNNTCMYMYSDISCFRSIFSEATNAYKVEENTTEAWVHAIIHNSKKTDKTDYYSAKSPPEDALVSYVDVITDLI